MEIGIMGLAGSGKTTVFNALAQQRVEVGAYGSSEPHRAAVKVPDERLTKLSEMFRPQKTTPAEVRYVDVAGGMSSAGETKGAALMGQLRTADALVHVVRAFESLTFPHPKGSVDPKRDFEEMNTDLALADLGVIERRLDRLERELKMGKAPPNNPQWRELELLQQFKPLLENGGAIREVELAEADRKLLRVYGFLTEKPMLVLLNTGDDVGSADAAAAAIRAGLRGPMDVACLAGRLEMELGELPEDERVEFMSDLGIEELGLGRVVRLSYQLLDLISFFTVGDDECRAWTVRRNAPATEAAGQIHSDIARGFIRAEVVRYEDLVKAGGMTESKKAGVLRQEGKTYQVQDGDVVHFLFNV